MADPSPPTILVIDDEEVVRKVCVEMLHTRGYRTVGAPSVAEGLQAFGRVRPAAVLLDMKLPDGTGIDVLRELQRQSPVTPVVVISGLASVNDAVEAMRVGASDYLQKPVSRARLFEVMDRILNPPLPGGETDPEKAAEGSRFGMVGRSPLMRRIYQLVEMAAPTKCRVFVTGESGTGKELIARGVHALSPRRDKAFVELNCAAIPSELIESEMFGHVKGSFTGAVADRKGRFEAANGGTLFLDELGDMSLMTQAKLLRVLQENMVTPVGSTDARPVDVRVVCATSKNIQEEMARGAFREDLYHRLNVVALTVPPLRERPGDIPTLAKFFLERASARCRRRVLSISEDAERYLVSYAWPGNVRELENAIERAVVLGESDTVLPDDLPETILESAEVPAVPGALQTSVTQTKRELILTAWRESGRDHNLTAAKLRIHPNSLRRLIRVLGLRDSLS